MTEKKTQENRNSVRRELAVQGESNGEGTSCGNILFFSLKQPYCWFRTFESENTAELVVMELKKGVNYKSQLFTSKPKIFQSYFR